MIAAATCMIAAGCSHKKNVSETTAAPEISVAEAVTDSVVVYNQYPGVLKANNSVSVVARVDGTVTGKYYTDGQLVERGQLLFTIEDTQYRDLVNQASAALETARSNHEYATAQYAALTKALQSDAVSQMEVNKAKSTLEQAEAAIRTAQAQLQTARTNLAYCRVTSPYRGHISAPTLSVGSFVGGAAQPVTLATVYEDASLFAVFHIDDKAMQEIIMGNQRNHINLDSIPLRFQQDIPQTYWGALSYISPQVDPSTGTLELRATVDNTGGDLHDGMYVTISLPSASYPHATLVKDAAISTDQLGKYLYTVNDSSVIVYTPVKLGPVVMDSMRVVDEGIEPGMRYVTRALLKVRPEMKIRPVEEK